MLSTKANTKSRYIAVDEKITANKHRHYFQAYRVETADSATSGSGSSTAWHSASLTDNTVDYSGSSNSNTYP